MMFGGKTDPAASVEIIDRAIDAGINFFDTANVYNRGRSEEVVGQALKRDGKRDRIVLATKVHGRMIENDPNGLGNHRRHIIQQCEASLRRLQTDWIDIYQLHRPESGLAIDETLRALDDLIRAGKVRYIGTSTFAAWQLMEALWVAKELGLNRFVSEQPPYHLLDRRIERELVPFAQTYGVAIIPWSPLAGGFLTGKYRSKADFGKSPRGGGMERYLDDKGQRILEALDTVAKANDATPAEVSLAWLLAQPGVTAPIASATSVEQVRSLAKGVRLKLSDEDLKVLTEAGK